MSQVEIMQSNSSNMPDKIFYINLDRRPDRNQNVQKLLKQFNLQNISERISATDGSKLNLDTLSRDIISEKGIADAKDKTKKTGIPLTPGGIGCALSHRSAWKKIVDQNLGSGLILEDDIRINKDFIKKLHHYMRAAKPLMYDILFIGYHPASIKYIGKNTQTSSENSSDPMFVRSSRTYGLFGYIVSRKGAEKLMKIFPIDEQIDSAMSDAQIPHNLNIYLVKPEDRIITSDPSEDAKEFGTDIQKRESFETYPGHGYEYPSEAPDVWFYHLIWFLTAIVALYLIGMFSGLLDKKEKIN